MSTNNLNLVELEGLATCAGFIRGALRLESYPWAEAIYHDLDRRGAVAVKAANGVGKTERIATPAALWHASVFPHSLAICTAGVFRQVKEQLFPAIRAHAHKFRGWTFNECEAIAHNGSRILGFSTDEAEKFEGWHNDNLLVIVDEAKSVPDSIYEAIERCQPTRLLVLSSPGGCSGFFYRAFGERRKFFRTHTVTAAQCAHISPAWISEQVEKYGEHHPLVRSMIHAEFMTGGEDGAVIPLTFVERCLSDPPEFQPGLEARAFCDFAAGGDENVLAVRRGNRVEIVAAWRERDTMKAVGRFINLFREQKLEPDNIAADEGGLGKVMCDAMAEMNWPVRRVNNGSPSSKPEFYANTAAEIWYEGRRMIEKQNIILPNDRELIGQLTSRLGWTDSRGRMQLEPKEKMRERGVTSPDRADAVLGAMAAVSNPFAFESVEMNSRRGMNFRSLTGRYAVSRGGLLF